MRRWLPVAALLASCDPGPEHVLPRLPCSLLMQDLEPPASEAELLALLREVQATFHPALDGVALELVSMSGDQDFFAAGVDLTTLDEDGLERTYIVRYGERILSDPPPFAGTGAIMIHELQHVLDYTEMDADALADFALWYAEGDIAEYERATDEAVLEAGCGAGLIDYRVWLYGQVDDETEAQKREDYYTPEEIEAWMADHG